MAEEVAFFQNGKIQTGATKALKTDAAQARDLSIQARADNEPVASTFPTSFSFGYTNPYESIISPWWSQTRDMELREFWMRPNNDILQGAISSMIKKSKAWNWVIEGPQRVVNKYQKVLISAEFQKGWSYLLGKMLSDYFSQDKGGFWELMGNGDPNGPITDVLEIANLDARFCQLTGDPEYPVIFNNPKTERTHRLHASRVCHFVDMPSPAEGMNDTGFCAVSRVIGSSDILLKINKYKNEKLSDLPEAGLLLFNNVLPDRWADAQDDYQRETRHLGQQHWRNIMTMFGLDPTQPATADFISFSNLPDAFNELETTNIYLNIVALAFGVDIREFWPISGGSLGSSEETAIMHSKARGKGVGEVISMVEREINNKVLPDSATFYFDFKNDEEDLLKADIDGKRTETIMAMWQPDGLGPVNSFEIRQMLADNVSYFKDDFLDFDATMEETATDMEIAKWFGPLCQVDNKGYMKRIPRRSKIKPLVEDAVTLAAENYRKGMLTAETVAEFALSELIGERVTE